MEGSEPVVLFERQTSEVALVTFNRPDVLNAINDDLVDRLTEVVDEVESDETLRVIIFTGAGRAFMAGADLREMQRRTSMGVRESSEARQNLFGRVETLPQVTVAALNGFALGGGCEFAMSCTLRVASSQAKLGQPEVNLGLIPGAGGTQRLPRLIGIGRALDLVLTGRHITADEALQMGLVNKVVSPEDLLPEARRLADTLLKKGPVALRLARQAVYASFDSPALGYQIENANIGFCAGTADKEEGVSAFLEKRPPVFKNR
jgi:enoyl-CoA hydratase/carnithine racemase